MKTVSLLRRALFALACLFAANASHAALIGPSAYLQSSDSPFTSVSFSNFYLQNFEGLSTGFLNTVLGSGSTTATSSTNQIVTPGSITDSVDGDDGLLDGSGLNGRSLYANDGSAGITFTFGGTLPTHAGIVWTDGGPNSAMVVTFEAFDQSNTSMGTLTFTGGDNNNSGGTSEDRFFGASNAAGISKIVIKNSAGGIEVDHFQYGTERIVNGAVPDSGSTLVLGLICMLGLLARRRRS